MSITASMVKELRERTGAGMMECKKALVETNGDLEAAAEALRKSGQAKADKKSGRVAADGRIVIAADGSKAMVVEVNSETDFVAKDENFIAFAATGSLKHRKPGYCLMRTNLMPLGQSVWPEPIFLPVRSALVFIILIY